MISASGRMVWIGLRMSRWSKEQPHWESIDEKHIGGYFCTLESDEYFSGGYYAAPDATEYVRQETIQGILNEFKLLADLPDPEHREDWKDYEWTRDYELLYSGAPGVDLPETVRDTDDLKEFTFELKKK